MFSSKDIKRLESDGFLPEEISDYNKATFRDGKPQNFDINSDFWKAVRKSRRVFVGKLIAKGASEEDIARIIRETRARLQKQHDISDEDASFVFLRQEYGRSFGTKPDYKKAREARSKDQIEKRNKKDYASMRYK